MKEKQGYTVIGFGLAGAVLCWRLYRRNIPFRVVDSGKNTASKVAAGISNPVVFKRLTKSWMIDELLPEAEGLYSQIEADLGVPIIRRANIRRVFASVEEENNWSSLEGDDRFKAYLRSEGQLIDGIEAPFGTGVVITMGSLDLPVFLEQSEAYFKSKGIQFEHEVFDYNAVVPEKQYVFCEGYQFSANPWFNYLLLKPAQGEVLVIECPELNIDEVINKNVFIQPLGNSLFKVGATYNWTLREALITEEGKEELLEKLRTFLKYDFKIVGHQAGIRPTIPDRRPYLGTHPARSNLHIFNGLGTKGVMLAPYFSGHLLDHLLNGKELMPEVNITRYRKHFRE